MVGAVVVVSSPPLLLLCGDRSSGYSPFGGGGLGFPFLGSGHSASPSYALDAWAPLLGAARSGSSSSHLGVGCSGSSHSRSISGFQSASGQLSSSCVVLRHYRSGGYAVDLQCEKLWIGRNTFRRTCVSAPHPPSSFSVETEAVGTLPLVVEAWASLSWALDTRPPPLMLWMLGLPFWVLHARAPAPPTWALDALAPPTPGPYLGSSQLLGSFLPHVLSSGTIGLVAVTSYQVQQHLN
ncbi:UNVERIFIED_CONTAM: hypothetical protein FKN15_039122 [Acipenser sinensis]